jgi:glycosyltransferase involved in cell wall biosynthesis
MIHTVHNLAEKEVDRAGLLLQRLAFRRNVWPVAISAEVAASFRRTYGFSAAATIPNGIALGPYRRPKVEREASRRALGIEPDEFAFLCVARFSPQKDHRTLLEAFSLGPGLRPRTRLLLAGDGELMKQTEGLAARLGLRDRVTFLGRRSDMPSVLAAADAVALSSQWEGNPLSVMEAMTAGKPVVATSVGAVPELLRDGTEGFLVPPGDAGALAGAMCKVCDFAPEELKAMGRAAASRACERFDIAAMTLSYADLYDRTAPGTRAEKVGVPNVFAGAQS